ncbi:restriction endonuclease [Vagococcus salmoninarum]|nr:restriction endonuclease [Vagococcus salmoninarum]
MNLTPTEFEQFSLDLLKEQTNNLPNVKFEHNKIIKTHDGNYQIDGYIEFELMSVIYRTIVECKHYKESISREKVQVLNGKIESIGAQKGILISSSNFQKGAREYAEIHGIALIQLTEAMTSYEMRANIGVIVASGRKPFNHGKPYMGVLVKNSGNLGSVSCSYLCSSKNELEKFLLE